MPRVLITGANRGLGFEHVKQYLAQGWDVIACCRTPSKAAALKALADDANSLQLLQMEVTNHAEIDRCAAQLDGVEIDVLINNAGILGADLTKGLQHQTLSNMSYDVWRDLFEVNVLAPFKVISAFQEHVAVSKFKVIMMMSSDLGSITNNTMGGVHAYRTTKASLNMLSKSLSAELAPQGIIIFSMAPGWCKTDMGTDQADVEVVESVAGQQRVIENITLADSGSWINFKGESVNW